MPFYIRLLFFVLILAPAVCYSQARFATCRVAPLWIGISDGLRSSTLKEIGSFRVDVKEGENIRAFPWNDDITVTVAVKFVFDYAKKKPSPYSVELAISATEKAEKKIFETDFSTESVTLLRRNWNLSVTKNAISGDRMYMFSLTCADGNKIPTKP